MSEDTCTSTCNEYIQIPGSFSFGANVKLTDYTCTIDGNQLGPTVFEIEVLRDMIFPGNPPAFHYNITLVSAEDPTQNLLASIDVLPSETGVSFRPTLIPNGTTVVGNVGNTPTDYVITITLNNPSISPNSYVPGDTYIIYVNRACYPTGGLQVIFRRPTRLTFTSNLALITLTSAPINNPDIPVCNVKPCYNIRVPQINITGQTTIDGSDVGDAIFTILDEFSYYKHDNPIPENNCMIRYINRDDVKETEFRQCCPYIVSVLRGKGKTLYDRALSIYNKLGEAKIGVPFITFYRYIILYGMAKYILSKLLYGDFNIDYLLGKYNEKFLEDLGNSRFCGFIEFFKDCESPVRGYNKYFKY